MSSGLVLLVVAVLGMALPSRAVPRMITQVVPPPPMGLVPDDTLPPVPDDTLPPVLQRIAQCESHDQHFTRAGTVLRGRRNPHDLGRFQINAVVWAKQAAILGYDLRTPEGNTQMARYLFAHYGSRPWHSSEKCWSRLS